MRIWDHVHDDDETSIVVAKKGQEWSKERENNI